MLTFCKQFAKERVRGLFFTLQNPNLWKQSFQAAVLPARGGRGGAEDLTEILGRVQKLLLDPHMPSYKCTGDWFPVSSQETREQWWEQIGVIGDTESSYLGHGCWYNVGQSSVESCLILFPLMDDGMDFAPCGGQVCACYFSELSWWKWWLVRD